MNKTKTTLNQDIWYLEWICENLGTVYPTNILRIICKICQLNVSRSGGTFNLQGEEAEVFIADKLFITTQLGGALKMKILLYIYVL